MLSTHTRARRHTVRWAGTGTEGCYLCVGDAAARFFVSTSLKTRRQLLEPFRSSRATVFRSSFPGRGRLSVFGRCRDPIGRHPSTSTHGGLPLAAARATGYGGANSVRTSLSRAAGSAAQLAGVLPRWRLSAPRWRLSAPRSARGAGRRLCRIIKKNKTKKKERRQRGSR